MTDTELMQLTSKELRALGAQIEAVIRAKIRAKQAAVSPAVSIASSSLPPPVPGIDLERDAQAWLARRSHR